MGSRRKRTTTKAHTKQRTAPERGPKLDGPALWVAIALPVLVTVISFVAFWPALDGEFVSYDDDRLFVTNTSYRGFAPAHLSWMFTTTFMGHYQPLTWLSSALDYTISGMNPASYHRNNLILHALNSLLVYFVALRLLTVAFRLQPTEHPAVLRLASAVTALLFAVHPLRVESVAWASERRDVLSVFFLLLALLSYLRAFRAEEMSVRSGGAYVCSWVLLGLSLLAKSWGMSFFLLLLILDVYPLRRLPASATQWLANGRWHVWAQKIPYVILGLAAAVMAGYAQQSALSTMRSLEEWSILNRVVQAFYGLSFYLWRTLWPAHLTASYELPYHLNPLALRYVLAFVGVLVGVAAVILLRRRCPALMAATLAYVIILAPVLGFVQSGPQFVAEKYSYVSCIGWALLAGGGLFILWRRVSRGWIATSGVIVAAIVVLLLICTWRQSEVWHDSKSLWRNAIASGIPSAQAHANYGILLRKEGRLDDAIGHYRTALDIRPDAGNAWYALGNVFKEKRNYVEAEEAFHEAVKFMTQKHSAYLNLGNMYFNNLNRRDDAIAAYRAAIKHIEAHRGKMFTPTPYLALGIALHEKGEVGEARRMFEVARKYRKTRERAVEELRKLDRSD